MKSTGIVREVGPLGKFIIPQKIRCELGIEEGDSLEFFIKDNNIVLKKYVENQKNII